MIADGFRARAHNRDMRRGHAGCARVTEIEGREGEVGGSIDTEIEETQRAQQLTSSDTAVLSNVLKQWVRGGLILMRADLMFRCHGTWAVGSRTKMVNPLGLSILPN
jgi:hypothetical protein